VSLPDTTRLSECEGERPHRLFHFRQQFQHPPTRSRGELDNFTAREGKRLAKGLNGAVKIAGQEAAEAFEQTIQEVQDEKAAEEMGLEEKDFNQELGITEGKCATP
jgi:hypothetical protein